MCAMILLAQIINAIRLRTHGRIIQSARVYLPHPLTPLYIELLPEQLRSESGRVRHEDLPDLEGHGQEGASPHQRQLSTLQLYGLFTQHSVC